MTIKEEEQKDREALGRAYFTTHFPPIPCRSDDCTGHAHPTSVNGTLGYACERCGEFYNIHGEAAPLPISV